MASHKQVLTWQVRADLHVFVDGAGVGDDGADGAPVVG